MPCLSTYPLSERVTEDDIGGILTAREFHQIQATIGCRPVLDSIYRNVLFQKITRNGVRN